MASYNSLSSDDPHFMNSIIEKEFIKKKMEIESLIKAQIDKVIMQSIRSDYYNQSFTVIKDIVFIKQ